jgi:hypothetical protein
MDYVEAGLLILLVAAGSVIAADLVRRTLDVDLRRRQHEVGNPLYMQIGVVFAVLLAFVFNEVFGEYNAAAQAINGECGALHGAAMLANDLSDGQGKVVEQAILDYSRIVVSAEWEALSHRQPSVDAQNAFHKIVLAAGRLNPTRSTDSAIQSQLLSLISQAHAFRETRLFHANQGLPITIWVVLLFYSLLLVAFVLFAGVESRVVHLFFTAAFSTSVILVLIVVRMLDYPFEGALTLSNADFIKTIAHVSALVGGT